MDCNMTELAHNRLNRRLSDVRFQDRQMTIMPNGAGRKMRSGLIQRLVLNE